MLQFHFNFKTRIQGVFTMEDTDVGDIKVRIHWYMFIKKENYGVMIGGRNLNHDQILFSDNLTALYLFLGNFSLNGC